MSSAAMQIVASTDGKPQMMRRIPPFSSAECSLLAGPAWLCTNIVHNVRLSRSGAAVLLELDIGWEEDDAPTHMSPEN